MPGTAPPVSWDLAEKVVAVLAGLWAAVKGITAFVVRRRDIALERAKAKAAAEEAELAKVRQHAAAEAATQAASQYEAAFAHGHRIATEDLVSIASTMTELSSWTDTHEKTDAEKFATSEANQQEMLAKMEAIERLVDRLVERVETVIRISAGHRE